jgi:hypothetical protein
LVGEPELDTEYYTLVERASVRVRLDHSCKTKRQFPFLVWRSGEHHAGTPTQAQGNTHFLKRGKSFAYPLIKEKRVAQLINGKPG